MLRILWRLFYGGIWLGSTVFGGGAQAYPSIRRLAGEYKWLSAEEVDAIYPLAMALPGPTFLNLWGAVAARVGGGIGSLVAQVSLMLPSLILVIALPLLGRIEWISTRAEGAMLGAEWAATGLIMAAGVQELRRLKGIPGVLAAVAAVVLLFLGLRPLLLTALSTVTAVLVSQVALRKGA